MAWWVGGGRRRRRRWNLYLYPVDPDDSIYTEYDGYAIMMDAGFRANSSLSDNAE